MLALLLCTHLVPLRLLRLPVEVATRKSTSKPELEAMVMWEEIPHPLQVAGGT
jgi:hypothetical protein